MWEEQSGAGGGHRVVFPGHQRAQPLWLLLVSGESLACSASDVREGAWLCTCWERMIEFVNDFKGAVCYSTALKHPANASWVLQHCVVNCGGVSCLVLPFFRQPSQVYRNILTALAESG